MSPTRTGWLVAGACALAALRVLWLAAVFPPFNNVDEVFHYDLVVKAAGGEFPVRLTDTRLSVATRDAIALYGSGVTVPQSRLVLIHNSPEYMNRPANGVPPPVWQAPPPLQRVALEHGRRQWDLVNYLAVDPPLYYVVAGAWHRGGRALGLSAGHLFYWTRALDALVAALLVWVTWGLARACFPRGSLVRFGAPVLVAFFPQDTLHAVTSDVLAPLAFGVACWTLLRFAVAGAPSVAAGVASGLAIAAALLTKGSTAAILAVAVVCVAVRVRESGRTSLGAIGALAVAAAVPVAAWTLRFAVAGVPGAAAQKIASFGWTTKKAGELWDHPVLTLGGARHFLEHGVATFWRGELIWHKTMLILPSLDTFYVVSSVILLAAATLRLAEDRGRPRLAGVVCVVACAGSAAWLGLLSMAFHFPARTELYPTATAPYLSGRLLIAALVPFAIAYVAGLEAVLGRLRLARYGRAAIVALVAGVMLVELALMWPALDSAYNWFALLRAGALPRG